MASLQRCFRATLLLGTPTTAVWSPITTKTSPAAQRLGEDQNRRNWNGQVLQDVMVAKIRGYPCVLTLGAKGKMYGCARL